jgi:hypothetical protein
MAVYRVCGCLNLQSSSVSGSVCSSGQQKGIPTNNDAPHSVDWRRNLRVTSRRSIVDWYGLGCLLNLLSRIA